LFWRWPLDYQTNIRDGIPLHIRKQLPRWQVKQRHEPDAATRGQVCTKLTNVREKEYIAPGPVIALTSYFPVKKGDTDIRMVYDGTKSGLNAALWAPWFPLPTIDAHLRSVEPGYYMGDIDIGEMFLNFILDENIQKYAGIDLTPYFPEEVLERGLRLLWERLAVPWGSLHRRTRQFREFSSPKNLFGEIILIHITFFGGTKSCLIYLGASLISRIVLGL
jgi:hypothetical protein